LLLTARYSGARPLLHSVSLHPKRNLSPSPSSSMSFAPTRFACLLRTLAGALALVGAVLLVTIPAHAASLERNVADLGSGEIDKLKAAIAELASNDDPRALAVLRALDNRELKFDSARTAFIVKSDASGPESTIDALTGAPATPAGNLEAPLMNNAVRRSLGPALAQLRLQSKDESIRLEAATEVAKRPSDELRDAVATALEKERVSSIKRLLRLSLAQIDL